MLKRNKLLSRCNFFIASLFACISLSHPSVAKDLKMSIVGVPPDPKYILVLGTAWTIFLDGPVDAQAAERLDAYFSQHNIPDESWVILNSPGGNLFEGMELGRVIRKHRLRVDVGKRQQSMSPSSDKYDAGGCYSACTLAYVGGSFRYLNIGSHFGIHRFAFDSPQKNEADIAQIASATIVTYLRSMDIDPDFFSQSTKASAAEIYEPPLQDLKQLNVVTYGFDKPRWSVESNNGVLYLKGERKTVYGINKFILFCNERSKITLYIIFDSQKRDAVLMSFPAHSLMIDGRQEPIVPIRKEIKNGWFNSAYELNLHQLSEMTTASSVGVIVQGGYGAPVFLGFDSMPFQDGAKKLAGLLNSCGISRQGN
jgi:hypothetical protein